MRDVLFIDADDTLWENFAFFEAGRARFLDHVEASGINRREADHLLTRIDAERTGEYGFGSVGFMRAMERTMIICFEQISRFVADSDLAVLLQIQEDIFYHPVEPYPGVERTLADLEGAHQLILVTKGFADEQLGKVARSGLDRFFQDVVVVPDKTMSVYQNLLKKNNIRGEEAWMVGNSPRSDINPAAAAGMGTILVEKDKGWDFEEVPLKTNGRFRRINDFSQLKLWFGTGRETDPI